MTATLLQAFGRSAIFDPALHRRAADPNLEEISMRTTEMTLENIQAAAGAIPADGPVFMLNMLRYRERAEYAGADAAPCSGREAYHERYRPAFGRVAEGAGVKVAWVG